MHINYVGIIRSILNLATVFVLWSHLCQEVLESLCLRLQILYTCPSIHYSLSKNVIIPCRKYSTFGSSISFPLQYLPIQLKSDGSIFLVLKCW